MGEAIQRMRNNQIHFEPGFDGEFGRITIFNQDERQSLSGQQTLFIGSTIAHQPKTSTLRMSARPSASIKPPKMALHQPVQHRLDHGITLNCEQLSVVEHGSGPMIVTAGPGTGKTHTIAHRMARLIQHQQTSPHNILAVTFTNKAAKEMQDRLERLLGDKAGPIWVDTFHGLGLRLLRSAKDHPEVRIIDDPYRQALAADSIELARSDGYATDHSAKWMLEKIVSAKQLLIGPQDDMGAVLSNGEEPHFPKVYQHFQALMENHGLMDFEDLIFKGVRYLTEKPLKRRQFQERFLHIFVDEFQDINHGQYQLLRCLASPNANLCVIGDPDQAIYGFRGSDIVYFKHFKKDFPNAKTIHLLRNYRSTETILKSSFQMIQAKKEADSKSRPRTHSTICGYEKVSFLSASSAQAEAVQIGRVIEGLSGGTGYHSLDFGKVDQGNTQYSFADFAILTRTSDQGRFIGKTLMDAGIPCQIPNRNIWQNDDHVSKLMAVLRVLTDQGSFADFTLLNTIFKPTVGQETLNLFKRWAYAKQMGFSQACAAAKTFPIPGMTTIRQKRLVSLILTFNGLRRAVADGKSVATIVMDIIEGSSLATEPPTKTLSRFIEAAQRYQGPIRSWLRELALNKDVDYYHPRAEKVALLTMHAAKGLEIPVVFIAGCEDGLIPYSHPGRNKAGSDTEEERRLFYVAMTRAKERLIFSWSAKRILLGRPRQRTLSPFVDSIARELTERLIAGGSKPGPRQMSLFE
jgi:superfamily I DNA/RNA helicase